MIISRKVPYFSLIAPISMFPSRKNQFQADLSLTANDAEVETLKPMHGAERIPLAYHRLYREITVTADTLIDILISISAHPLADLYRSLDETYGSFLFI